MRVLCVLLLWLTAFPFPAAASASVAPETQWRCYRDSSDENPTGWANTEPACVVKYCQWRGNSSPGGSTPWTACESTGTGRGVRFQVGGGGAWYTDGLYAQTRQACPSGSVLENGVCEPTPPACPAGQTWNSTLQQCAGFCQAGAEAKFLVGVGWGLPSANGGLSETKFSDGSDIPLYVCEAGCKFLVDPTSILNGGSGTDYNVYWPRAAPVGEWVPIQSNWAFKGVGSSCSPGEAPSASSLKNPPGDPPPAPPPEKKPDNLYDCIRRGGAWGSVNGVDKCVQKEVGDDGRPTPTSTEQSGNPSSPENPASGASGAGSANPTTNSGGSDGNGPGGGTGGGAGSGGAGGPTGAASGPTGAASDADHGKIDCKDLGTCPDANAGGGLPQRPKLWESKYPDGVAGVWNQRVGELKQTPVYQLASNMLPQVNGGDAPTWELNFDLPGVGDFGSYTLGPESWVWSACRAIVIVSALIFAFRLVFGGA